MSVQETDTDTSAVSTSAGTSTGMGNTNAASDSIFARLQQAAKRKAATFTPAPIELDTSPAVLPTAPEPSSHEPSSPLTGPGRPPKPLTSILPSSTQLPPYPSLVSASDSPDDAISDLLAYLGSIPPELLGAWLTSYNKQSIRLMFSDLMVKLGSPTVQELAVKSGQSYQNTYMVVSGKGSVGLDRLNTLLGALGYGVKSVIVPLGVIAHDRVMGELGMLDHKGEVK